MVKRDLIGQRFGHLTVVNKTDERQDGYFLWCCQCDCGKEVLVNTKRLVRGTMTSCGCVPKTTARNGRCAEDLTGRVFGELPYTEPPTKTVVPIGSADVLVEMRSYYLLVN